MITRETIARWLFPNIAKNAARYCRMRDQIRTEIWWLSEFPDVRDTLQRLLDADRNHWRRPGEPHQGDFPDGISEFREMLRARASSPEMARLKADLTRALDANSRQASCIHQCAAAIGPDTSATIDGLPRAVKRLVEQLQQRWDALPGPTVVSAILEAVSDVIADATVSYPAGREAGPCVEYDEDELRQNVAAALPQEPVWTVVPVTLGECIQGHREVEVGSNG